MVTAVCPVPQLAALKPQLDLPLGPVHGIASVDDIPVGGGKGEGRTSGRDWDLRDPAALC